MEDLEQLKKRFRIRGGVLERYYDKEKKWLKAHLYIASNYVSVEYWYNHIPYHRVYWQIYYDKQIPKGMMLDHIDGNKLNNDLSNLRVVTPRENSRNTPRIRAGNHVGVSFEKTMNLWTAVVFIRKESIRIGRYKQKEESCRIQEFAESLLHLYHGDKREFRAIVKDRLKEENDYERGHEVKDDNGQYCFGKEYPGCNQ